MNRRQIIKSVPAALAALAIPISVGATESKDAPVETVDRVATKFFMTPVDNEFTDDQGTWFSWEFLAKESAHEKIIFKAYPHVALYPHAYAHESVYFKYPYMPYYQYASYADEYVHAIGYDNFLDFVRSEFQQFIACYYADVDLGVAPRLRDDMVIANAFKTAQELVFQTP